MGHLRGALESSISRAFLTWWRRSEKLNISNLEDCKLFKQLLLVAYAMHIMHYNMNAMIAALERHVSLYNGASFGYLYANMQY